MRVDLVNVPSPFLINDRGCPPLGLMYLAANLRAGGHEVRIVDLTGSREIADHYGQSLWKNSGRDLCEEQGLRGADVVGVYAATAQYPWARSILFEMRELANGVGTPIMCIGGHHVSAVPRDAVTDGWDYIATTEYDLAIAPLINQWANDKSSRPRPGEGRVGGFLNPPNLDELPFPARDCIDLWSYTPGIRTEGLKTTMIASRGCPFACTYCQRWDKAQPVGTAPRSYRYRSAENVVAEIRELQTRFGVNVGQFVDDIFCLRKDQLRAYSAAIAPTGFKWRCHTRCSLIDEEAAQLYRDGGCEEIAFGTESASDAVLTAISKNDNAANLRAVKLMKDVGLRVKCYFIFGFPEDKGEDNGATSARLMRAFLEEAQPDYANVATLIPLPGSALGRYADSLGWNPSYELMYHNGLENKGGLNGYPWWPEREFAPVRDALTDWVRAFSERQSRRNPGSVDCPNSLADRPVYSGDVYHNEQASAAG